MAANADRAALCIVLAQQQAHHRRFARAARADNRDLLAFVDREAQTCMRVRTTAGIREAHAVEGDIRLEAFDARCSGCCRLRAFCIEQRVNRIRRGLADHSLMQHAAQIAQRPEDFAARHQHDQQRFKRHLSMRHAPGAQRNGCGGAKAHAEIREKTREQAECKHPERAVG